MSEEPLDARMQRVLLASVLETEIELNRIRERLEHVERAVFGRTAEPVTESDQQDD